MPRSGQGTSKEYVPIAYYTFVNQQNPQASPGARAIASVVKSLTASGYKGQVKLIATGGDMIKRHDSLVLHSSNLQMAQFGAQVALKALETSGVQSGGGMLQTPTLTGTDFGGTSFNDKLAEIAEDFIRHILDNTKDYGHFQRNVANIFAPNGQFVQQVQRAMPQS